MVASLAGAVLVLSLGLISADEGPYWERLNVKWPFYIDQPRTRTDAKNKNYTFVGYPHCGSPNPYNGFAYVKDSDYSVTLLFSHGENSEEEGYIVGIQAGITKNESLLKGYPNSVSQSKFVEGEDGRYLITAYFVHPDTICKNPRSSQDFKDYGTGKGLWFQYGDLPSNLIEVPLNETNISLPWVKGKYYPSMGFHYYYNISLNMDCDEFYPLFILYNNDSRLDAFGWDFNVAGLKGSYEVVNSKVFNMFMLEVPQCMTELGDISAMHVFLRCRDGEPSKIIKPEVACSK